MVRARILGAFAAAALLMAGTAQAQIYSGTRVIIKDPSNGRELGSAAYPINVTGGGGGTEYTEDAAAAANPVGNVSICVRRDTLTVAEVSADGDNVAVKCDSRGQLYIHATDTDALLTTIDADTGNIVSNTAVIATLNTTFGGAAEAAISSGACTTFMGCVRDVRDALRDTAAASIKISQSTTENDVDVASIAAGTALIGKINANIAVNAPVRIASAAGSSQDETQVCAAACSILRVSGYNASAGVRYIKFTNATAANTTPGTTAVYWSIPIPATSPFSIPVEQEFSTAATVYLVTGSADNDTTSVTAADILGLAVTSK